MAAWTRWWPLTGIAFVALWVVVFILTDSGAGTSDSDAEILAYYANSSNRDKHIASFLIILAASLIFVWFLAKLRERLVRAEGGEGTLTALAYGAGIAAVALWLAGSALFASAAFATDDTSKFKLDPNTFRILDDTGYGIWISGTTVALLTVVATAVIALRTGLLPKWLAWLSFPVAATMLVSFFFIPFLIMLGWILVVSVTFLLQKETPVAPAVP